MIRLFFIIILVFTWNMAGQTTVTTVNNMKNMSLIIKSNEFSSERIKMIKPDLSITIKNN